MKLRGPGFQSHARAKGGAIIERGDGELILPPSVQLVAVLGDQLAGFPNVPAPDTTFIGSGSLNATGAQGGTTSDFATMRPGIWHVDWLFSAHFTGTTNVTRQASLGLLDPAGRLVFIDQSVHDAAASPHYLTGSFTLDLGDAEVGAATALWTWRLGLAITVAGDVVAARATIIAQPIIR